MVDPGRLRDLLDRIRVETSHLQRLALSEAEALLADSDTLAAVKYRFIVAIEASIDAGRHLVASAGLRAPQDFADTFQVLAEGGVLDEATAARGQDMARFRNLLVHGYARVDDRRVVEILQTRLGDLDDIRRQVAAAVTD